MGNFYSVKDRTPKYLKSLVVYKFSCARCNSYYAGVTCRHFQTRIDERIRTDKNSKIYKHLHVDKDCFNSFTFDCFSILDTAQTEHLKIKEGMYIDWENPNLNKKFLVTKRSVQHSVQQLSFFFTFSSSLRSFTFCP